jgi:RHS repeat-associated protein
LSRTGADFVYENGRKVQETLALSWPSTRTGSYAYTDAGRLSTSTIDGQATTYSFDAAGNITGVRRAGEASTTLTYSDNRLTSMGSTIYGWDEANGRRVSMRRSGEPSTTYSYTDSGAMSAFLRPGTDSTLSASYSYDASGRRTRSVDRAQTSTSSVETTTTWIYDGLNLVSLAAERSDGATWSITYVYDERARPYVGIYRSGDASTTFLIVTSDRGDVVELVDSSGTPFATYGYDAWGNPASASTQSTNTAQAPAGVEIALRQPLRYAGYAFDTNSSLYYCSQRYYDPMTIQWMTKDPARADGEESAYQYCGGDPVGKVDPSGLWSAAMHKNWTRQWSAEYLGWSKEGWAATVGLGAWYTDQMIPWEAEAHFNLQASPRRQADRWLNASFGPGSCDSRVRWMSTRFSLAVGLWKLRRRHDSLLQLGIGLHAVQDTYAHGNAFLLAHQFEPASTLALSHRNHQKWDDPGESPWRVAATRNLTVRWLRMFARTVGLPLGGTRSENRGLM